MHHKDKKCSKHGDTTFIELDMETLHEPVEACIKCLEEKIEEVTRKKAMVACR